MCVKLFSINWLINSDLYYGFHYLNIALFPSFWASVSARQLLFRQDHFLISYFTKLKVTLKYTTPLEYNNSRHSTKVHKLTQLRSTSHSYNRVQHNRTLYWNNNVQKLLEKSCRKVVVPTRYFRNVRALRSTSLYASKI